MRRAAFRWPHAPWAWPTAALEDALSYAQERESFGQPIWKHQAIGHYLADMATKLTAARQLTRYAADALRQR